MSELLSVASTTRRTPPGMLRTSDVCELTGLTPRQLRWWTDKGLLQSIPTPHSPGYARLWPESVVDEIAELQRRIDACPLRH